MAVKFLLRPAEAALSRSLNYCDSDTKVEARDQQKEEERVTLMTCCISLGHVDLQIPSACFL